MSAGSWLPDPDSVTRYNGEIDVAAAARMKFFAGVSVWLTLFFDACLSGVVYFESGLTSMGALCSAGIIFAVSLLIVFAIIAIIWADLL